MKHLFLCLSSLLFASNAFCGWTSGGGEILKDAHNPWFLNNTKEVTYCIKHDSENFGTSLENVRLRIRQVLDFWKIQLASTDQGSYEAIRVGTQNFSEVSCSTDVDVVFQFGVLDETQKKFIKEPKKFVALSVRTEYDLKKMKAKGFVYVAPESGPLAFELPNRIPHPWGFSDAIMLLPTLIHEMGHVFGIQHDENIFGMSAASLERQMSYIHAVSFWKKFEEDGKLKKEFLFNFDKFELMIWEKHDGNQDKPLPLNSIQKDFFGLSGLFGTFHYVIKDSKFRLLFTKNGESGEPTLLGSAELAQRKTIEPGRTSAVRIYFPSEQQVGPPMFKEMYLDQAYYHSEQVFKGTYASVDGKTKRQIIFAAPNNSDNRRKARITGVHRGELIDNVLSLDGF